MARNLDLTALRSFVTVAETGGVTKAAQQLHLTHRCSTAPAVVSP
jgi:hypothetical protein